MIKCIKILTHVYGKYKYMIFLSVFFFYLGCGTIIGLGIDCIDAALKTNVDNESKYLPNPENLESEHIEYAVFIISSPANIIKRDAIRATWKYFANNIITENGKIQYKWNHSRLGRQIQGGSIKFYFVVGTKHLENEQISGLKSENSKRNDMLLLESLEDSYINLSKKVLHALKWFSENLKNMKYLIKCDDDSFVRIDLIVQNIAKYGSKMNGVEIKDFITFKKHLPSYKGLYWGYFNGKARVYFNGKWQEKDWFLCDKYLPYALGGAYVISKSIVDYIGKNADIFSLYNSEDVSMGVWTAPLDGINRVHDIRFDTEWKSRGCVKDMLVRHKQTPSDMFQMYKSLVESRGEILCKTEIISRKSYYYNWAVLPSECCK